MAACTLELQCLQACTTPSSSSSLPSLTHSRSIISVHSPSKFPPRAASVDSVKPTFNLGETTFKRPDAIPWHKDICNRVQLIGLVYRDVEIKYLDTGKVVARSSLKVTQTSFKGDKEDVWYALEFWEELAEIAAAHLKRNDFIFVSGLVYVENYIGKDNLQKTLCKVNVKDLKYVQTENSSHIEGQISKGSSEALWEEYFDDPSQWWDNRVGKKNPKYPDFKNKSTGDALWIESWLTPSWVKARLEEQDYKRSHEKDGERPMKHATAESESLWQAFFANPFEWWDNRSNKKTPQHPDFKHKTTGEALWISSVSSPAWVNSQLAAMDSKAQRLREHGQEAALFSSRGFDDPRSSFQDEDLEFL